MSEELHKDEQVEQETAQEFDVEAMMERMKQLEQTNQRILEESKSYKSKYKDLRENVEQEKKAKLTEEENFKELLELEKNRNHEISSRLQGMQKQVLQKELNFKVASAAKDAFSVEDVINSLPRDLIEIDDEKLEIRGVDDAVARVKETKPYLFDNKRSSGMTSKRPDTDISLTEDEIAQKEDILWKKAFEDGVL